MFGLSITKEYLSDLACAAASDFLENQTPLTEAVVKVASACEKDLTAEHVRRICEMTYHDVYERMHKMASAADRYISFDPPNANTAIGMLRARRVEAPEKVASASIGGGMMFEKSASARRRPKFEPINAFSELMKTASSAKEEVDYRQLRNIQRDLKEAVASVATELSGAQLSAETEMAHLIKEAYDSYKDGYSAREILHACVTGADLSEVPDYVATKVASVLAEELAKKASKTVGLGINKTASLGEVDPEHPLPRRFQKVAEMSAQRAHLELTLEDLKKDRDYFQKQVESLYER